MMRILLSTMVAFILTGCLGMPETVTPVANFDLNRYLGRWYEIARLDHPFERGLERITAEYSMRDDGGIFVTDKYGDNHLKIQKVKTELKKVNTEIGSLKRKITKLEKRKKALSEVLTNIE